MKLHPLCQLFPAVTGDEFKALALDIKNNGLREEIITLDGMILDGQNRHAACISAGVKSRFDKYIGDDPAAFVISKNLARRHLTAGQRAMIAAAISDCQNSDTNDSKAAKTMKVSRQSVSIAKKIRRKSPSLAKRVSSGKVSLNAAAEKLEPKTRMKNPVLPSEPETEIKVPAIETPIAQQRPKEITPARFQATLDELEAMIPADCDHKKYGVIANKLAERQMNFGRKAADY